MPRFILPVLALSLPLLPVLAQAQPVALPAANSPEAVALLDKACAKMLGIGRGTFKTTVENDNAIMRRMPHGMGGDKEIEVDGGWSDELRWGTTGDDAQQFVLYHGRMLCKDGAAWRLRGSKLTSGANAPFLLDPQLLFQVLRDLPAEQRKVAHVEAAEIGGKQLAVLGLSFAGAAGDDFAACGVLPAVAGGGGFMVLGGGMAAPQTEMTVDLALFVEPASGDVLRIRTKAYEKNPALNHMQFKVNDGGGAGDDDSEKEEKSDKVEAAADGKLVFKKGLPERQLQKDVSMTYLRTEFTALGGGEAPKLDTKAKSLVGLK